MFNTHLRARYLGTMVKVTVRMFATIREASGDSECILDASDIQDLMDELARRYGGRVSEVIEAWRRDSERLVLLLNGRSVLPGRSKETALTEGDEISIFPPVSGG